MEEKHSVFTEEERAEIKGIMHEAMTDFFAAKGNDASGATGGAGGGSGGSTGNSGGQGGRGEIRVFTTL